MKEPIFSPVRGVGSLPRFEDKLKTLFGQWSNKLLDLFQLPLFGTMHGLFLTGF
jgi:hypothetical protein